jgi:hypothetical protein
VWCSLRTAIERSIAVMLDVLLALALGDVLSLNGFTVLVAVSLGVAELVLRLPPGSARAARSTLGEADDSMLAPSAG